MSAHKELALDEKRYHVRFGSTCVTGYSEVIRTSSFSDFEQFFAALQVAWDKLWLQVFSAEPSGGPGWGRGAGGPTCNEAGHARELAAEEKGRPRSDRAAQAGLATKRLASLAANLIVPAAQPRFNVLLCFIAVAKTFQPLLHSSVCVSSWCPWLALPLPPFLQSCQRLSLAPSRATHTRCS